MPFRIGPSVVSVLWITVIGAGVAGFLWVAEKLWVGGGTAERAKFAEAARKVNVNIETYNSAEEAIDAIVTARLAARVAAAGQVKSELKYTGEQAAAINAIRRAGQ